LTAMVCGLAPALRVARPQLSRVLQAGSRRATGAGRRSRDVLMVVEIALSVALVAVSALLIQSLMAVQRVPLGFDASHVFTLQFRLPQTKYAKPEDIARFFKNAIERVRAVPGVESAALVRAVPFSGNGGTVGYAVEGRPAPDPASAPQARFHLVTPDPVGDRPGTICRFRSLSFARGKRHLTIKHGIRKRSVVMQQKHLPVLGARYWTALSLALRLLSPIADGCSPSKLLGNSRTKPTLRPPDIATPVNSAAARRAGE